MLLCMVCTISSLSGVTLSQPTLTVLQENLCCYFQGTSTELEELVSSPALARCPMEPYPPFLDHFGFHSPLPRGIPTHAMIYMMIQEGMIFPITITFFPITIISVLII